MADLPPSSLPDPDDDLPPRRRGRGWMLAALISILVVAAIAWYWREHAATPGDGVAAQGPDGKATGAKSGGFGKGAAGGGGRRGADPRTVLPVAVAPARTADFTVWLNALGNVTARSTVTVRPRVDGQLARVLFREGQLVKAGALLAELAPRPFAVQVTQDKGQLARAQAQLANARVDMTSYQTQLKKE